MNDPAPDGRCHHVMDRRAKNLSITRERQRSERQGYIAGYPPGHERAVWPPLKPDIDRCESRVDPGQLYCGMHGGPKRYVSVRDSKASEHRKRVLAVRAAMEAAPLTVGPGQLSALAHVCDLLVKP